MHNGTLAIFVAVEVLDSVEISVPAAVYSLFMFVLAALWGMFISRRRRRGARRPAPPPEAPQVEQRRRPAERVAAARWPRCEMRSFSAGSSSAEVRSAVGVLVGDEEHVVAEAAARRAARG